MNITYWDNINDTEFKNTWDKLVNECEDAWFWSTQKLIELSIESAIDKNPINKSFIVLADGRPVGIAPLIIQKSSLINYDKPEATLGGGPLPWPSFTAEAINHNIEQLVFEEIEKRVVSENCGRIILRLSPGRLFGQEKERFSQILKNNAYLDASYTSHYLRLEPDSLSQIRKRYKRYIRKFTHLFDLSIIAGQEATLLLEENYYKLHVLDAGGQFRSRKSYQYQIDLVRNNEAFLVVAEYKEAKKIIGMLMVSYLKKYAYDHSVAVDPEFQNYYVSHCLKWKAIETLINWNAFSYEFGRKAVHPSLVWVPSQKNYGISNFKEGWSRGGNKEVFVAEKYFDKSCLDAFMEQKKREITNFFSIRT